MYKFFIDCGGHLGESISKFKKSDEYGPSFVIHTFEPSRKMKNKWFNSEGVVWHKEAAWILDGKTNFYLDEKDGDGSSLLKEKNTPGHPNNLERPITVKCIDFSNWILQNFWKDDFIILKMDIEGAEYKVLEKMIKDKSLEYVDKMYIEWHYHKIGMGKEEHESLKRKVKKICKNVMEEYKII